MSSFRKADASRLQYWVNESIIHTEKVLSELGTGTSGTSILWDLATTRKLLRRLRGLECLTKHIGSVRRASVNLSADDALLLTECCPRVIDWYNVWENDN